MILLALRYCEVEGKLPSYLTQVEVGVVWQVIFPTYLGC